MTIKKTILPLQGMITNEVSHNALTKATWEENLINMLDYVEESTKGDLGAPNCVDDYTNPWPE